MIRQFLLWVLFFSVYCNGLRAQKPAFYADPDQLYRQGLELYDKKQYASAQKVFLDYYQKTSSTLLKSDAYFYAAACGIELVNRDSEWMMRRFVVLYPASTKINLAWYFLAKSNYRKKKYPETVDYFNKVDPYGLDKEQLQELRFKRGYSYMQMANNEKAKEDFAEIKDIDNKYAAPANYYYSHIAYEEKAYEQALSGFNRLISDETFGAVVPYYITQIYFIQGKYDKVTQEAPRLLKDTANIKKAPEINRMIGESYFKLNKYEEALPWLKKSAIPNAQGSYAIGYCYYKTNDWANAAKCFEAATEANDTIAQNAWYHLADCNIKLDDKLKAKNAFYSAFQLGFDKRIAEDALFSFAKLSYELDFNPYNDAVKSFARYLKEFPTSKRADQVYGYLINVYSTTRNYEQAIKSIESLSSIDVLLKPTYQKLVYFYGVEFFNNNDLTSAETQFRKSLRLNADPRVNALNQYWLAEINYIRKDYSTAIDAWKKFQLMEGAVQLQEYDLSNYALGYAYFQRKENDDFTNANLSFRKFLLTKNVYDENKLVDATIRAADCYFMNRDFAQASEYYKDAIGRKKMDVDYSLYQKSLCDGLLKKYDEKIVELIKLEGNYPKSSYAAAAINEVAETYYNNLRDLNNAIVFYEKILSNYKESSFINNAYAQLGNIYYEQKKDDKAFEYYDKYVRTNLHSAEAQEILENMKKIFEAKGDVAGEKSYFENIGKPLSENEIEKKLYLVASDVMYSQKNLELALPKWEEYLTQFPNGRYATEAKFQLAECQYAKGQYEKALPNYVQITTLGRSVYQEIALAKASYLFYKEHKYAEALPLFLQLEEVAETPSNKSAGRFGVMRCAFYQSKFDVSLEACKRVMSTEKLTPQQTAEAKYIYAKSLYETNRLDDAMNEFKAMVKTANNVSGAEAWYLIAKIQLGKQDYKEVEKSIKKLIGYEYTNDEWNTKGMLLLADMYIAKNEPNDAEIILTTIIYGEAEEPYLTEAKKKLEELKKPKQAQPVVPEEGTEEQMELVFPDRK